MNNIRILILIILTALTYSSAIAQHFLIDELTTDELFSTTELLGNKVLITFRNRPYPIAGNQCATSSTQLVVDGSGNVLKNITIDSSCYDGHGVLLSKSLLSQDTLYHFGVLVDSSGNGYRMIIRKTDLNLNLFTDSILNFNNAFPLVTSAFADSSSILIAGLLALSTNYQGFIMRLGRDLQLIDSATFNWPIPNNSEYNMFFITDSTLNLLASSNFEYTDLMLRFRTNPLGIEDTLYMRGFESPAIWGNTNCYGNQLTDSTYQTACEILAYDVSHDSLYTNIGWFIWDPFGNIIDTFLLFSDTLLSNRIGTNKSVINHNDTVIIAFTTNQCIFCMPSDSTSVAVVWSNLSGQIYRIARLGSGTNYTVENLIRFDNGNLLLIARRFNLFNTGGNDTHGLEIWILDAHGSIIQSLIVPEKKNHKLSVFPNPSDGHLTIQMNANGIGTGTFRLYDLTGRFLTEIQLDDINSQEIDLADLAPGIYLYSILTNFGNMQSGKLIINR